VSTSAENRILYFSALTASLSGLLFGFDTVVISGAEQTIQNLWQLSSLQHGLAISMALWGTVVGALAGRFPTEYWGRKPTLVFVGVLYMLSALGSAFATGVNGLIFFRFLGGLGIGISTVAAPLYISEISPPEKRGKLAGMFQFNIVLGILLAYISNALLSSTGPEAWRYMLGVQALPATLYILLCLRLHESPRWLILRKQQADKARNIFSKIQPALSSTQIHSLVESIRLSSSGPRAGASFFSHSMKRSILLAFAIAFFNQLSGINAILYFAPRIFELTGLGQQAAMLQSVGIGLVNLVFTLLGLWLIDLAGRKTLLYWGSLGYILSLGACSWAFATGFVEIIPYCIFAFIAAHAIGQGAVIWVFISEIFPNQFREAGQSFGSSVHWIFAALLTLFFPKWVSLYSPASVFAIFCALMVAQLIWIRCCVPETKGIALEDIVAKLQSPKT